MTYLARLTFAFWEFLKEISGENDYARYRARADASGAPALTAEQFYLQKLRRKYSRITRCC